MRRLRFAAVGLIGGTAWLYAVGLTPVDTYLIVTALGLAVLIGSFTAAAITRTRR